MQRRGNESVQAGNGVQRGGDAEFREQRGRRRGGCRIQGGGDAIDAELRKGRGGRIQGRMERGERWKGIQGGEGRGERGCRIEGEGDAMNAGEAGGEGGGDAEFSEGWKGGEKWKGEEIGYDFEYSGRVGGKYLRKGILLKSVYNLILIRFLLE